MAQRNNQNPKEDNPKTKCLESRKSRIFSIIITFIPIILAIITDFPWQINSPIGYLSALAVIGFCIQTMRLRSVKTQKKEHEMQEQLDNLKALRKDCTDSITSSRTKSKEEHYIHKLRQLDFKIKELEERRRLIQIVTQGIYAICILVCSFFVAPIAKAAFVSAYQYIDTITQPTTPASDEDGIITPDPQPTAAPVSSPQSALPTFTPVPIDDAQHSYDLLWNAYFVSIPQPDASSLEQSIEYARTIIENTWMDKSFSSIKDWPMEEIEIYSQTGISEWYEKSASLENELRQSDTDEYRLLTGTSYVESTSKHIRMGGKNNLTFSERDLGVGCLRGMDLLSRYLRNQSLPSPDMRNAYYSIACLLQHCADFVYNGTGDRSYILYSFSYVCYEKAQELGYDSKITTDNLNIIKSSMENACL